MLQNEEYVMSDIVGILRGAHKNTQDLYLPIKANSKLRIGKHPKNDVVIPIDIISSYHCKIFSTCISYDINITYITDLSKNGTYLNGKLIGYNKTVILFPSCVISFVSGHLNMIYIQVNADLSYFIPVIMSFKPGLLLYPNQQTKPERTITVTTTSMLIGYGSQAEVSLAYDMAQPRYQLACRKTKKSIYPNTIKAFQLETEILKSNKHANVLSMVAQYSDDPNDAYIYSFFPLYTGGTLYERMMRKGLLKEKDATFIVKQVLSGLHYIHKKDIIHFDVKTENILLSSYGHRPRAVISDFGLAIYKPRINEKHLNYYYGTPSNTSPEMFDNQGFDEKVDCWAAGIMFYYMLSGIHPFIKDIDSENNVKKAILNSQLDLNMKELAHVSNIAKDLISNLLVKDPKERYSCYQGLQATLLYWNWQKDDNAVLEDFKHERYLWFHDEDYNDPTLDSTDGQHPDDIEDEVERIRRLRSTENIKRRITLQSNDIDMIYSEDIRKSTYEQSQFNEILKVFSKKETGSVGNIIFSQQ